MGLWKSKPEKIASVTASAGAVTRQQIVSASTRAPIDRFEAWQQEVDTYDEWGPGFVGSYLDLVAEKVARCDGQLVDSRTMMPISDVRVINIFNGVWSLWRGQYNNRYDLLKRHARLRVKHGECFVIRLPKGGGIAIAHKNELTWDARNGIVKYRDPVTELMVPVTIDNGGEIPNVWRSWSPLDRDSRLVQTDMKRALVHVREYINVKLRQDTDTVSPLVRNKIIMFGEGTEQYKNPDDPNDPKNGLPDAFVDYLNLAAKREQQQYHTPRRPQDTIPFPMIGPDLHTVDLGRNSDPRSSLLEDSALYAFARSVRVPVQYIHSGPGVAKYDNEAYVLESLIQDAIEPTSYAILGDIWRVWARPLMVTAYSVMMQVSTGEAEYALRHYTIGPDSDRIRPKIDNIKNLEAAYRVGATTREAYAGAMDTIPLDLPDGMTEFEFWLLLNKVPTGILNQAPGMPEWFDTSAPAQFAQPAQPAPLAVMPAPTVAAAAAAPIIAAPALLDHKKTLRHVIDRANETDKKIVASLVAHAQSGYSRIIDDAARNLSRIAPSGSDLKKRLAAAATSHEKLAVLTAADVQRYDITPDKLIPDDAASHVESNVKRALDTALAAFVLFGLDEHVFASDAKPTYDTQAGAVRLADGVLEYARYMILGVDGATPRAPESDGNIPMYHVRDAMALAGGAPVTSTRWGGTDTAALVITGAAAGVQTREAITTVDSSVASDVYFHWAHGFFHTPTHPNPEHLALNGTRARITEGKIHIDVEGHFPGDTPGCTCAWVLELS